MSQCKQTPGARLGARRRLTKILSLWVWAPKVLHGPLAVDEPWPVNLHPRNIQVPISAGLTDVGRRY